MSDKYEQQARKLVDEMAKSDPDLVVDREAMVRDIAAALPKVEAVLGPPGSMTGPPIWDLAKAPFCRRINGVEVERGLWPWRLILMRASSAVVSPIFGLIQFAYFWNLSRGGKDARITDGGVEVFSKRRRHIATYSWIEIAELRKIFDPPIIYWQLVLLSGKEVSLPMAEIDPMAFRDRGITVHEERKFRYEYK